MVLMQGANPCQPLFRKDKIMQAFVVADVHGFYDEMLLALDRAGYEKDNPHHCFVSLGDLLDRGNKPQECLDFVNSIPDKNKILIRGNHEDLIVDAMHRLYFGSHDYHNGTAKTAMLLAGTDVFCEDSKTLAILQNNESLNTYLNSCIDYYENDKLIFVHGWIPVDIEDYGKLKYNEYWRTGDWKDARWTNGFDAWHSGVVEPNKTIWCGHWHTSYAHSKYHFDGTEWDENWIENIDSLLKSRRAKFTPFEDTGIVGMDACTAYSGFVNCKKIGRFKR